MRKSCSVLHFSVGFKNTLSLSLLYQFTSLITLLVTEPDRHTSIQCFSSCWWRFYLPELMAPPARSSTGWHGYNCKQRVPALVGFNLLILLQCSFTSKETHKYFIFFFTTQYKIYIFSVESEFKKIFLNIVDLQCCISFSVP